MMKTDTLARLKKAFEDYAQETEGIEFWFARDLQKLLGYDKWENFFNAIEKAKVAGEDKKFKGLRKENLRDHMEDIELIRERPLRQDSGKEIHRSLKGSRQMQRMEEMLPDQQEKTLKPGWGKAWSQRRIILPLLKRKNLSRKRNNHLSY